MTKRESRKQRSNWPAMQRSQYINMKSISYDTLQTYTAYSLSSPEYSRCIIAPKYRNPIPHIASIRSSKIVNH
ncbi:hypothetical protein [Porphyromonas pogonae]|uniref:hypothetical protein n=1 Tax=Porphyromonas pogonae TaxID=867595 RepID=UPI002E766B14|nr:hypothetical protein [Porphyromonas pogonae]